MVNRTRRRDRADLNRGKPAAGPARAPVRDFSHASSPRARASRPLLYASLEFSRHHGATSRLRRFHCGAAPPATSPAAASDPPRRCRRTARPGAAPSPPAPAPASYCAPSARRRHGTGTPVSHAPARRPWLQCLAASPGSSRNDAGERAPASGPPGTTGTRSADAPRSNAPTQPASHTHANTCSITFAHATPNSSESRQRPCCCSFPVASARPSPGRSRGW